MMKTTENVPATSPFNSLPPKKVRDLPRDFLLEELRKYYNAPPPPEAVECDYALWECAETGLQFAWPMVPGNTCFYEWVSSFSSYYPAGRWEYRRVQQLLGNLLNGTGSVIDIGCGKGDFLRGLGMVPPERRFGLDLNEPAVAACRRNGFQAFCGTIDTGMQAGFLKPGSFSAVTAFHCLEHVPDPVGFMRGLVRITAPGGRVFVSTPYSPMSFESEHFDVLNHPPHHLTRWNLAAYRRLAEMLGVKMRHFIPFSHPLQGALRAFRLRHYAPTQPVTRRRLWTDALFHAPLMLRLYGVQKERARRNHGISADVILVELQVS